ncbi:MAG: L-lactate dehydrogenase [Clostridia bacterium]|nr:L-lactate dehydrogenase [Clostridia bacterium]MBR2926945.1 L-lactate dehydrogenase [Clostridia bacterium]
MEQKKLSVFSPPERVRLRKCAVIGCGNVGATVAYTLMQTGWFSEMVLIDIDTKKAEGEASDLAHGLPFHSPMDIYAGDYPDLSECGLIIITAGANQQRGETRMDLLRTNARIFQSIVEKITRYNRDAILLVVTNPVDVLTRVAYQVSGYPACRVIGSGTVLDTARLKQLVGSYLGVDSRNVHSFIIGEHGDSELVVWSSANVSGVDLHRYCDSCGRGYDKTVLDSLFREARDSAYQIIDAKGATYYAIAESVKRIVAAIVRDENTILPVSALVDGHYGLEDVFMSLPCILNRSGVKQVLEIPLNEEEENRLHRSARTLKGAFEELSEQPVH